MSDDVPAIKARRLGGDPPSARARIAAEFDGWAPALPALITDDEAPPVLHPLHALPTEYRLARLPEAAQAASTKTLTCA